MSGKFITLYGINNMGKTTHAKRLVERLKQAGHKAVYMKYPVYDMEPTGPFINGVLRGGSQEISEDELQLWFVLNRYQQQKKLQQLLADGVMVVAEDYTGTGIAWGEAKGLERDWLKRMNKFLVKEDLAIMIEGKRQVKASEAQHIHETNNDLVRRCERVHQELADEFGWRRVELQDKKKDTEELIWKIVDEFLKAD